MNIIRLYNQNRRKVWRVIIIIASIIILIQMLNFFSKKQIEKEQINENSLDNANNDIMDNSNKKDFSSNTTNSLIGEGSVVNDSEHKNKVNLINDFFEFCNNQKYEEAYNLLTDDCKDEMYPEVNVFKTSYCDKIFKGKTKKVDVERWRSDIYRITIIDDIMSSGKYTQENNVQDYIAIKEISDGKYKLNINGYVGREEINAKGKFIYNIEVNVLNRDTYMDYEIYTLKIKNTTNGQILMDPLQEVNTMYIEDKNNVKYFAYTHELSESQLLIEPGEESKLRIKYYSKSISEKKIKNIVFSRVIVNYYPSIIYTLFDDYQEFRIEL